MLRVWYISKLFTIDLKDGRARAASIAQPSSRHSSYLEPSHVPQRNATQVNWHLRNSTQDSPERKLALAMTFTRKGMLWCDCQPNTASLKIFTHNLNLMPFRVVNRHFANLRKTLYNANSLLLSSVSERGTRLCDCWPCTTHFRWKNLLTRTGTQAGLKSDSYIVWFRGEYDPRFKKKLEVYVRPSIIFDIRKIPKAATGVRTTIQQYLRICCKRLFLDTICKESARYIDIQNIPKVATM